MKEIHTILTTQEIVDIDKLLVLQKEAKELYEFLTERLSTLTKTDETIAAKK
ncbi:MAG: hypothetical protein WCJ81_02820 [bacterium]